MKKIKHFFHSIFVCYLVVSILFSGVPFEGFIQHIREGTIVGVMYDAQQNGNVIDTALDEFVIPKMSRVYANGTTDAMMVYDTLNGTSTPKIRLWDGTSWGSEQSASPFYGTEIYHMMLRYAPTRDEAILVALTNTGQVQAQIFNGTSWSGTTVLSNVGSGAVNPNGTSLYRGFDIEYEQSSGDAIVVAGDGSADPNYYVWNGSSWASGVDINIPTTGVPYWIELASRPGSNELALITLDSSSDVYGMRWTGSTWDTMGTATAWETTASTATRKAIDVAYEQTSGDIMFAWGYTSVGSAHFRYRTYSGATLGTVTNVKNSKNGGVVNWLQLAPNPTAGSDQIMIGLLDAGADLNTFIWSGTAWSAVHPEHSSMTENEAVEMDFSIVFETSSSNPNDAWLVWNNTVSISRRLWNGATSSWQSSTSTGDDNNSIVLNAQPNSGAILAGLYLDDTSATTDIREFHLTGGSQTWSTIAQLWGGPTRRNLGVIRMAQAVQAYSGSNEAMLAYVTEDSTTYPQYRRWNGSAWSAPASASGTNGELRHMVLKTSSKRDEAILVTLGNNGRVEAQVWNGTSGVWGSTTLLGTLTNATGSSDIQSLYRGFDIEYESSSGDALVVVGDGTADPNYWVWNGASWTGPMDINIPTSGPPNWIELASRPGTDQVAMILIDANTDVYGMRWTGSAWDTMGTGSVWDATGAMATEKCIDVAYEQTSGDALFLWGDATSTDQYYRTYSGTTLSAATLLNNPQAGGVDNWITLASNPMSGSNQILLGILDAASDINTFLWSGTAWSSVHPEHTGGAETNTSHSFHIAYETHTSNPNVAWLAYGDGNTLTRKRWNGTSWAGGTTQGDNTDFIQLSAHPYSGAFFMMAYESSVSSSMDITENHLTGGTQTWGSPTSLYGGPVARTALPFTKIAIASEQYIPPLYTQQSYRWFANTNSTNVGTPLAAQNTAATLSNAGELFRLRTLLRMDSNGLVTNGQSFKLQFAAQSGTCDTAFSGETYADVTTSTVIAYHDNTLPADEAALTANASDPTDGGRTIVNQSYQELNNFTNSQASILNGQDGKWDFSLYDNDAPINTTYCFRVVKSDGTALNTYTALPQITTSTDGGSLSVDIVDAAGVSIVSPSMQMNSLILSLGYQTATGVFGVAAQKIRVNNTTSNTQWSTSIAADAGVTAFWDGAIDYDFNDPTANVGDGGDADTFGGRMTLNASVGTLGGTCSSTGITKGSAAGFSESVTDSITLLTAAGGTADIGCYWDFTGIAVSQTIPGEQSVDNYSIDMTLTVVAI